MVSVLTIGPKVRGFETCRGRWTFKGDNISSTLSFGGEVMPETLCRKILRSMNKFIISLASSSCLDSR
jgi:hypothetical protein